MNNDDNLVTWRNKKTGKLYRVEDRAIDCTNGREGLLVIIYHLKSSCIQAFVREESEFYNEFEKLPCKPGVMDGYRWDDAQRAMLCQ
jgi:hypothetical protein